jgi:hypothetical protein
VQCWYVTGACIILRKNSNIYKASKPLNVFVWPRFSFTGKVFTVLLVSVAAFSNVAQIGLLI